MTNPKKLKPSNPTLARSILGSDRKQKRVAFLDSVRNSLLVKPDALWYNMASDNSEVKQ